MKILSDVRSWIILLFIIRLYGITNPPVEISHNWRQCQTAMVARNFNENPSILHPAVNMEGGKEVAMEFPFFNYLVFLTDKLFGFAHWHGRLINLLITSMGIFFYYKIIRDFLSEKSAFYATLILSVSVFFSFGRKIMPDTFSVSLVLAGIYFAQKFLKEEKSLRNFSNLILCYLFLTLGALSKLPVMCLFAFLIFPFSGNSYSAKRKLKLFVAVTLSGLTVAWWYLVWNSKLYEAGALRIIFPLSFAEGISNTIRHLPGVLEKFYFSTFNSYLAFAVFLAGIIYSVLKKEWKMLLVFSACFGAFLIFVLKSALFFYYHTYYIIPVAPAMAMMAGYGITLIKNQKLSLIVLFTLSAEALLNQQHDLRLRKDMLYKAGLENLLDRYTARDEKIFMNTGPSLQQIYFANRKGWLLDEPSFIFAKQLDSISDSNYSLVVLDKSIPTAFDSLEFAVLYADDHYLLLQPSGKGPSVR